MGQEKVAGSCWQSVQWVSVDYPTQFGQEVFDMQRLVSALLILHATQKGVSAVNARAASDTKREAQDIAALLE